MWEERDAPKVDLTPEETIAALKVARFRRRRAKPIAGWCNERWPHLKIRYNGEWWDLGFTDLMDDVGVGISLPIPDWYKEKDPLRIWRERKYYGARLHRWKDGRKSFSLITHYSDG